MPSEPPLFGLPSLLTEREITVRLLPENEGPLALVAKTPTLRCAKLEVHVQPGAASGTYEIDGCLDSATWAVESDRIDRKDRAKIESLVRDSILDTRKHPEIRLRGTLAGLTSQKNPACFDGSLVIRGTSRPVRLDWHSADGRRWNAQASIRQRDFGITPIHAFMGQLRSKDELKIEIEIALP